MLVFTAALALTRLSAGKYDLLLGLSAAQKLQRLNEILAKFYERGTWRGVHTALALTSVGGIISLPEAYLRLDKRIAVTTTGSCSCGFIEIRSQQWQYQENGPGFFNPALAGMGYAIDLGDNASGVRRYQLTGAVVTVDALAYSGLARKRFVYITNTADIVTPDCYSAIEIAVRAMNASDEQATALSKDLWGDAFMELDSDLGEFEQGNELGVMQMDPMCCVPSYNAV